MPSTTTISFITLFKAKLKNQSTTGRNIFLRSRPHKGFYLTLLSRLQCLKTFIDSSKNNLKILWQNPKSSIQPHKNLHSQSCKKQLFGSNDPIVITENIVSLELSSRLENLWYLVSRISRPFISGLLWLNLIPKKNLLFCLFWDQITSRESDMRILHLMLN